MIIFEYLKKQILNINVEWYIFYIELDVLNNLDILKIYVKF